MDRTTGKKGTDAAASQTRSAKKGNRNSSAQKEKRAARATKKSESTPQPCGDENAPQLSDLALKELGTRGTILTRGMINKALQGDVRCTMLIRSLLKDSKTAKPDEQDRVEISQASLWEAEPEWNGELSEYAGELGSGRVEPEN